MPVIFGGGLEYDETADLIEKKEADLIVIDRALICDPELPNKLAAGELNSIIRCIDCRGCVNCILTQNRTIRCSKNPNVSKEEIC